MWSRRRILAALAVSPWGCRRATIKPASRAADCILEGGTIITHDAAQPVVEALAIVGDRVAAIGSRTAVGVWRGQVTRTIDLAGGTAMPGLVDAHAHLGSLGRSLEEVDLRTATSVADVVSRLRAADRGQPWITGRGWDQNLWPGADMPTHHALSDAFPERNVWLRRVDGHAAWANLATLRGAGIGPDTKAPAGGEILRDDAGDPTGVLVDAAMGLVTLPVPTTNDVHRWVLSARDHVLARGLTGLHDMGVDATTDGVVRGLAEQGELRIRVVGYADEAYFVDLAPGRAPDRLGPSTTYGLAGVKLYADGALGSRGAALLAPYADRPGHRGLMQMTPEQLDARCALAAEHGWQVATHAIGDAGNRAVLDAYARHLPHAGTDPRWRIEHAQILDPADIARFAELGVVASMQPVHATSDMPWVPARIGNTRLPGAYAWRSLLQANAKLAFGSDAPVELVDPLHGLYAAITRQDAEGRPPGGWLPEQRLDRDEAIAAFTHGCAYASHRDDHLGRLVPGYIADVTCVGASVLGDAPATLRNAPIRATIIAGTTVYEG